MEHPEPKRSEVRRQIDPDHAMYEKIIASGKYKGQHLMIMDGKVVLHESDDEEFWKKANKHDGKLWLYKHVPSKVSPLSLLHPLLGMYSE